MIFPESLTSNAWRTSGDQLRFKIFSDESNALEMARSTRRIEWCAHVKIDRPYDASLTGAFEDQVAGACLAFDSHQILLACAGDRWLS